MEKHRSTIAIVYLMPSCSNPMNVLWKKFSEYLNERESQKKKKSSSCARAGKVTSSQHFQDVIATQIRQKKKIPNQIVKFSNIRTVHDQTYSVPDIFISDLIAARRDIECLIKMNISAILVKRRYPLRVRLRLRIWREILSGKFWTLQSIFLTLHTSGPPSATLKGARGPLSRGEDFSFVRDCSSQTAHTVTVYKCYKCFQCVRLPDQRHCWNFDQVTKRKVTPRMASKNNVKKYQLKQRGC